MPELRPVITGMRGIGDAVRVADLATRQNGVVSRPQLRSCGLTDNAIDRRVAAGRLHRVHRGVYAVGHAALSLDGRLVAALLYAGPRAVLSHTTAAWVWRLIEVEPKRVHVTIPGRRHSLPAVRVHRSRSLDADTRHDLPLTTVARTLLDLATALTATRLRRVLAEADYRRLLQADEIEAVLGRGQPGSAALRSALDAHLPQLARTLSVLEERFLALCETAGLPLPEVNVKVAGLMVDALWPGQRVVVELDGHAAHGTAAAIETDRRRELTLRAAGYAVVRYTWQQITQQAEEVAGDVSRALAATEA
jgi:predicted transcriptional regulator of viral defense system